MTPGQAAAQGAAPATPPPRTAEKIVRTPEEIEELEKLRDRIQNRNPYRLDRLGRFEVPELGSIALAGLTEMQAEQRLSVAPQLKEFRVDIVRLPLERLGEEALKPFGYDLFAGIPTTFAPATDVPVPAEYVVGPGDQIRVQLYGDVNQSYLLTVGRDGRIDFPELGPVEVAGQTFTQVRQDLEGRVSRQMIGTVASVSMGETRSIRVFVLGEAYRPGSYTVSGLSTITNALFVSGGVKEIGSLRNIQLKRRGQVVSRLDLYDLLLRGDTTDDARLLPGDVIFIPPVGKTATVTGEVRRPAIYEIAGETSPRQMIELAGGLTADADSSFVRIERTNEQRQRVTVDVDLAPGAPAVALASGDVLRVLPIRATLENSVLVQGHVHRPGAFQYRPGMRISDVIGSLDELKPRADMHYVLVRRELPPDRIVTVHSADLARALAARGTDADLLLQPRDRIVVFDNETNRERVLEPLFDELRLQSRIDRPMQIVGVGGRVRAPGRYPLEPGMHVSDLIRAGGNLEEAAYGGQAELSRHRVINGEYRQVDLVVVDLAALMRGEQSADVALEPYDYLNVKVMPQWGQVESIEIVGEVRFPGTYPIARGETLRSIMQRAGGLTDLAFPEGSIFLREDLREKEQERIEQLTVRLQSDIAVAGAAGEPGGFARCAGADRGPGASERAADYRGDRAPRVRPAARRFGGARLVRRHHDERRRPHHGPAPRAGSERDRRSADDDVASLPRRTLARRLHRPLWRHDAEGGQEPHLRRARRRQRDPVRQRVVRPLGRRDTPGRHDRRAARRRADASIAALARRHADHLPDGDRSRGCELVLDFADDPRRPPWRIDTLREPA